MKLALLMFAFGLSASSAVPAQDAPALLQKYDCTICHTINEAKTGPAFVDVAAKYRGNPNAVSAITAVVRKGAHGSALWPMPPNPQVPTADARKIARYILALRK